ncbi:hypothetical protein AVEN_5581-1 [Araneus ventricosus]|uniref:Uncharacterized protein n=1 Tax=Araneus ventricosus TaxID=182803 RepID=A0A4Y2WCG5_ARAVE|nr:hypothetical protein AVEN_5581-1 [Araneus ventricosus]
MAGLSDVLYGQGLAKVFWIDLPSVGFNRRNGGYTKYCDENKQRDSAYLPYKSEEDRSWVIVGVSVVGCRGLDFEIGRFHVQNQILPKIRRVCYSLWRRESSLLPLVWHGSVEREVPT